MVKANNRSMNQGQTMLHRRSSEGVLQSLEDPPKGTWAADAIFRTQKMKMAMPQQRTSKRQQISPANKGVSSNASKPRNALEVCPRV
jgi:hypothetical protein